MARVRDFDGVGRVLTRSHREGISFFSLQTYAHLRDPIYPSSCRRLAGIERYFLPAYRSNMYAQFTKKCWDKRVEIFATYVQAHKGSAPETPWCLSTKKETSTRRLQNRVASDDASGARHQKKRAMSCCLLGKREIVDKHRDRLLLPAPFSIREYERVWPSLCACSGPEPRTNVCVF